jgi:hypothetical protein
MSELYLVLRHRLDLVTDWVPLGEKVLRAAMKAQGFSSNERVARAIPVSTKTWERWLKRGAIPRQWLPRVAKVLALEIEETAPVGPVILDRDDVEEVLTRLEAIAGRLEALASDPKPARSGRARSSSAP